MAEFQGVYVAAITPRGKGGEVDFGAAFELIDYLCHAGVEGIVLFGAAGEYAAFTTDERIRLLRLAVKRSRVPILAGVGAADLGASVEIARQAQNAGAAGLLAPPPLFFRYEQEDLEAFYQQFAAEVGDDTALLIDNTPACTSSITADTALGLIRGGGFAGMVDGCGDRESFARLGLAAAQDGFELLQSADRLIPNERGTGIVSSAACAVPELAVALEQAVCSGDCPAIERLTGNFQEVVGWLERFPPTVGVKAAAAVRGVKTGCPSVPLSAARQQELERFQEWFRDRLPTIRKSSHA